ncbi:hypothetical protein Anapl_05315 [Anas platyrhynchos]|uniref:Uncharacterized protein n=1 Tax=Anas platyrhynchos TaxID=8839 RepID=R0KFG5_ANAPL|nr:hypothetical protein Anapl_05315 [Anas platyrhynchos]
MGSTSFPPNPKKGSDKALRPRLSPEPLQGAGQRRNTARKKSKFREVLEITSALRQSARPPSVRSIESNQLGHWVSCSTGKAHVLNSARLPPNMTPASTMLSASNVPSLTGNPQTTTLVLKPISSQHAATLQAKFCLKTIPSSSRLKGDDTWSY